MKKSQRIRRDCPVPGCQSNVLKMSQHLRSVHALTEEEVQEYLVLAKTVTPRNPKNTVLQTLKEKDGVSGIGMWACLCNSNVSLIYSLHSFNFRI